MAAPLRLLIVHHPLGAGPGLSTWRPNASATTTSFTLPLETAPFNAAATPLQKYMCMIDGLNVVTPSGQNTHEGGIVAVMTGMNALGKGNTQQDWAAAGPSVDQLLLDKSPMLGGPSQAKPTTFGSLQLGADVRSDRDEVGPRVLSYKPAIAGTDVLPLETAAAVPRHVAPERVQPNFWRRLADRDRSPEDPGAEAVGL